MTKHTGYCESDLTDKHSAKPALEISNFNQKSFGVVGPITTIP